MVLQLLVMSATWCSDLWSRNAYILHILQYVECRILPFISADTYLIQKTIWNVFLFLEQGFFSAQPWA